MAIKSLYFKNVTTNGALSLQDGGTAPTAALTATGWTVAKLATPNFSRMAVGTKSTTFATTDPMATASFTAGSCWRSEQPLSGIFANTSWSMAFRVRASGSASAQTGAVKVRVWKSAAADGTGAVQVTSALLTGTTTAALSTSASATSTVTWATPGVLTFATEYLWVQCEWSIVVTGGANQCDSVFYVESAGVITTPDFVAAVFGTGALTNTGNPAALAAAGVSGSVSTSAALTSQASTLAGVGISGFPVATGTGALVADSGALTGTGTASWNASGALNAGVAHCNLALRSQELDAALWTKTAVTVTANNTTAPDGSSTADLLADTATNSEHGVTQISIPTTVGVLHTFSFYAKRNTHNWIQLSAGDDPAARLRDEITPLLVETEVFSATLTSNDGGWGGYTVRNVVPVTGQPDTNFFVAIFDFDDAVSSGNRYVQGLGTINGTPGVGSHAAFNGGQATYNRAYQCSSALDGFIYGVNSIKVRGSGASREVCARFEASTVASSTFRNVSIGIWDGTTTTSAKQGSTRWTPVELKWGGLSGLFIPAGAQSAYSDWAPFPDNVTAGYGCFRLGSNNGGWIGSTLVVALNSADLRVATGTTCRIGVNLVQDAGTTTNIYIGQQAIGDPVDFKATPKRLTWSGGDPSITHDGVRSYWLSDIVDLPEPWDKTKNYNVAAEFIGGVNGAVRYDTVYTTSGIGYYKNGAEAGVVDKTGYAPFFSGQATMVEILEVWTPPASDATVNFNLLTGAIGLQSAPTSACSISAVGDGWYRCSLTFMPNKATSQIVIRHRDGDTLAPLNYVGTGTSFWGWGAQFERGASASEYIPTASAAVVVDKRTTISGAGDVSDVAGVATGSGALTASAAAITSSGTSFSTGTSALTPVALSRTNLMPQSQTFDDAAWLKIDVAVTANTATAPDGSLTADTFSDTLVDSTHYMSQSLGVFSGQFAHTFSCYVKAGTGTWLQLRSNEAVSRYANFNVATGAGGIKDSGTNRTIVAVGNGWYRLTITWLHSDGTAPTVYFIPLPSDTTALNYLGTGLSYYIWGAQYEIAPAVTAYIPTVASAVTINDTLIGVGSVSTPAGITGTGALTSGVATLSAPGVSQSLGTGVLPRTGTTLATLASAGGSASLGTAALAPQAAGVVGAGVARHVATGTLSAGVATVTAPGVAQWIATGSLPAVAAAVAGAGLASSSSTSAALSASLASLFGVQGTVVISGTGTLAAQSAQVASLGTSISSGTGALFDAASTLTGAGLSRSLGSAALVAQACDISGAGAARWIATGTVSAQSATLAGVGTSQWTATGILVASASALAGVGIARWSALGMLPVEAAAVAGVGLSSSSSTSAALLAARASVFGAEGTVIIAGSGDLQAQSRAVAGAGTTRSTGSGSLSVADSSDLNGPGTSGSIAVGTLVPNRAILAGAGAGEILGTAAIVAAGASLNATGVARWLGAGAISAQSTSISGAGLGRSTGSGVLLVGEADATGNGTVLTTGAGALTAKLATVFGSGDLAAGGAGDLVAQDRVISGVGLGRSFGSGVLRSGVTALEADGISRSLGSGAVAARASQVSGFASLTAYGVGVLTTHDARIAANDLVDGAGVIVAGSFEIAGDGLVGEAPLPDMAPLPGGYPGTVVWSGTTMPWSGTTASWSGAEAVQPWRGTVAPWKKAS